MVAYARDSIFTVFVIALPILFNPSASCNRRSSHSHGNYARSHRYPDCWSSISRAPRLTSPWLTITLVLLADVAKKRWLYNHHSFAALLRHFSSDPFCWRKYLDLSHSRHRYVHPPSRRGSRRSPCRSSFSIDDGRDNVRQIEHVRLGEPNADERHDIIPTITMWYLLSTFSYKNTSWQDVTKLRYRSCPATCRRDIAPSQKTVQTQCKFTQHWIWAIEGKILRLIHECTRLDHKDNDRGWLWPSRIDRRWKWRWWDLNSARAKEEFPARRSFFCLCMYLFRDWSKLVSVLYFLYSQRATLIGDWIFFSQVCRNLDCVYVNADVNTNTQLQPNAFSYFCHNIRDARLHK